MKMRQTIGETNRKGRKGHKEERKFGAASQRNGIRTMSAIACCGERHCKTFYRQASMPVVTRQE